MFDVVSGELQLSHVWPEVFACQFFNVIANDRRNAPSRVVCAYFKVYFVVVEIISNFYLVTPSDSKERSSKGGLSLSVYVLGK